MWDAGHGQTGQEALDDELMSRRAMDDATNKAKLVNSKESDGAESSKTSATVALPNLIQQLLKNCGKRSLAALRSLETGAKPVDNHDDQVTDAAVNLLLHFQRLLIVRLYAADGVDYAAHQLLSR